MVNVIAEIGFRNIYEVSCGYGLEYATTTETMRKKYDEGVLRSRSEFTAA
jgi:hypothetical protein